MALPATAIPAPALPATAALFLAVVAAQRLWELRVSARHAAALRRRGARELGRAHYPALVAVHVLWLVALAAEVAWLGARPWAGTPVFAVLYLGAEALRQWARRTLGGRWTTRVFALPGEPPVERGPYRRLRHPNYVAVVAELAFGPLIFGAWRTAILGVVLQGAALVPRLRAEGEALRVMRGEEHGQAKDHSQAKPHGQAQAHGQAPAHGPAPGPETA